MNRYSSIVLFAAFVMVLPAVGMQQGDAYMPGRVVVQFVEGVVPATGHAKTGLNSFDTVASSFGIYRIHKAFPIIATVASKRALSPAARELDRMYYIEYSGPFDPWEVVSRLLGSKEVERAEPHFMYEFEGGVYPPATRGTYSAGRVEPDDPLYGDQTHFDRMEMEAAWDVVRGQDGDVVIGIVDGGTDWQHEDLRANVWVNSDEVFGNGVDDDNNGYVDDVNGWNFANDSAKPTGMEGTHGIFQATAVAGIAAAVTNNGAGIAGMSWNARFMPVNASCRDQDLLCWPARATVYAAENGADVITASYVSETPSFVLANALDFAVERGVVVVAAGFGNVDDVPKYPASYSTTLAVGGTQKDSDASSWHAYGRSIDVVAAAHDVNLTAPGNRYDSNQGIYAAVSLVAGMAALVKTHRPEYGVYEVMEQIRQTADDIDEVQPALFRGLMGRGRVNARRAVTEEPTPGIRMVEFSWENAGGDPELVPGETFTVDADFVNYGGDASALSVGLGVGNSVPFVTVKSQMVAVGPVQRLGTFSASFELEVSDSVPENHTMVLYVTVEDGEFRSISDHFRILANIKGTRTLQTSKLVTSVTSEGNIGYLTTADQAVYGKGFMFEGKQGGFVSALYEGGLLIGTGPALLVDCVRSDRSELTLEQNDHFQLVPGTALAREDGGLTTSKASVELQDFDAERPLGVRILQESYVDDTPEHEDFLVLQYTVTNANDRQLLTGMWLGLYLDWDLWGLGSGTVQMDTGVFNEASMVGMVFDSDREVGGVGVKVLTSIGQISYELVENSITYPGQGGGYTSSEKWEALSGGIGETQLTERDLAQMIGVGPFDLAPKESVVAAFALIGGHDESDILENAANAQLLWDNRLNVNRVANATSVTPAHLDFAPVYPNPGNGRYSLSFTLPAAADVELVIYNALSQEVRALLQEPRSAGAHTVEWNGIDDAGASVASGVYFARLVARGAKGRMTRTRPLVVVR